MSLVRLLAVGVRLLCQGRFCVKQIDNLFTELMHLVEQAEVSGIMNCLLGNGGVEYQLVLVGWLLLRIVFFSVQDQDPGRPDHPIAML